MFELTYLHSLNKNAFITEKGLITVEDVISSNGRDICVFLESLKHKKRFAKYYKFTNFSSKNDVLIEAVNEFYRTI